MKDHIPTFITKKPIGMVLPAVPGPNEYYADDEATRKYPEVAIDHDKVLKQIKIM